MKTSEFEKERILGDITDHLVGELELIKRRLERTLQYPIDPEDFYSLVKDCMENLNKIVTLTKKLNESDPDSNAWTPIRDYFALTGYEFNNGKPVFKPSYGIPIKAFMNTKSGEIKIYSASLFED